MSKFVELSRNELEQVNGGIIPIVITGAMVINGLGLFAGGFTVGYGIGYLLKK